MNVKRIVRIALAATALIAVYWCLRLAWADYLFRTGNAERAAALVPFRASYQAALGNWRRAVELNPYYSEGWNRLAVQAETAGDFAEAERLLLRAAEIDQLFEPRWALANFYLRRNRKGEFVKWLGLAAERSYPDRSGLFRLAARMDHTPAQIAAEILPPVPAVLADYVAFLTKQGELEGAAAAAVRIARKAGAEERRILLALADRLLASEKGALAHELWRALYPDSSGLLTNADLASRPLNQGFDWRPHWRAGVHTVWSPGRFRIALSGNQPEIVDLLSQYVYVGQPGVYRFHYRFRAEGLARESGVYWTAEGATPSRTRAYLSGGDRQDGILDFETTHPGQLVRLTLMYARTSGTVRQEGVVWIEGGMRLSSSS
ncbi:MAG: hypothetical protein SFV51_28050 [Bryobacteraceae bacterium]|nr:hypothetical protein [Bryobacteraceae bacterium]